MDTHTSTSTVHNQGRPTHRLPVEILACILNFLFPEPDGRHSERSTSEMAELYRLRLVSKLWKDLVEGMPTLWTYVSTAYPTAVVRDCLQRSKNHFLRISIFHAFSASVEALIERLRLLRPHSHRWITLDYSTEGGPDVGEEQSRIFLESPAPMLQSIYVNLSAFTSGAEVNLAGGRAKGVKHLTLQDGLLPWSSSLFHGLEELRLVVEETVPVEEILDIFVKSPALRSFQLSCSAAERQNNPTALATRSMDTVAASLKEVTIFTHPHITTHILSQISMPSCEYVELSADFTAFGGDLQTLDQAIAQFMPRIRETLSLGGRTTLLVGSESDFEWRTPSKHKGFQFFFGIEGTTLGRLIEWIRNLSAGLLESPLELEISLVTLHWQTLKTLGEWVEVTKLRIPWIEDPPDEMDEMDEMVSIPNFLGDVRVDPIDGLSWNFPNLRELDVHSLECDPLEIFAMLNKRYLPDSYVKAMEGLGISIQAPPQIDLRVKGSMEGGNATIMMALEKHWGVKSLNQGKLDES